MKCKYQDCHCDEQKMPPLEHDDTVLEPSVYASDAAPTLRVAQKVQQKWGKARVENIAEQYPEFLRELVREGRGK